MPRTARVVLPGYAHHIVQRGHNRQPVFAENRDYAYYLNGLREWKSYYNVHVYAYCLMTSHVHLVLAPDCVAGLGGLMKRLAGRQTRYTNTLESRRGTLWEGRYKSSPIDTDSYLLACCRYVELNPVRARMVALAEHYQWSSYQERTGVPVDQSALDTHAPYLALATDSHSRIHRYKELVHSAIPDGELKLIRESVQRCQLTGGNRFVTEVKAMIERRIEHRGPGRPVRSENTGKASE
jgi:putative transposase